MNHFEKLFESPLKRALSQVSGYETSSTTLVFCLYEMCANQQFQKKARESVEAVINHHDHFTYDTIAEMTYLDQIIKGEFPFSSRVL